MTEPTIAEMTRISFGVKQHDMCAALRIDILTLEKIENGWVSLDVVKRICNMIGIPIGDQ